MEGKIVRSSCSSDDMQPLEGGSEMAVMHRPAPAATDLRITKSSHIHIGPKYVSVTQNVDHTEVVEDLPFHRYIWHITKNATKAEKATCVAAMSVLIVCILLIIYFAVIPKTEEDDLVDVESDEWFIPRHKWLARKYNNTDKTDDNLRLVVISHTVSPDCDTFIDCAMSVKNLQTYYLDNNGYDIPYNFLIGHDGRVYEGLGWNIVGAHTYGYNSCSMGVAFVGDYREGPSYSAVTKLQEERVLMLFKEGVKNGSLHPQFQVLGAKDLRPTLSPGANLYRTIQGWSNYDHENLFKGRSCKQIQELFNKENYTSTTTNPTTNLSLP